MRFRTTSAEKPWLSVGALAVALTFAPGLTSTGALAQDKQEQSAWVKLCEKAPVRVAGADGKATAEEKSICLTHHERLDGNTGMVIVSAAIREIEGSDKESLMIMVPLGMALQPGVRAAVYSQEMWEKAQKKEDIDESQLKPVSLDYTLCHPAGCTAEIEATEELVKQMDTGGGLMVLAINAAGQPVGFPVPLTGFKTTREGKPVDNQLYAKERGKLMAQIRERQRKLVDAAKAEAAQKKQ